MQGVIKCWWGTFQGLLAIFTLRKAKMKWNMQRIAVAVNFDRHRGSGFSQNSQTTNTSYHFHDGIVHSYIVYKPVGDMGGR